MPTLMLAQAAASPPVSGTRLVVAALIGIALIVVLITRFKVHPFLALTIGSLVVAGIAGLAVAAAITSYLKGFGDTAAGVGTLIALGAMFGKLLADSGGGDQIADTIIGRSSTRTLPWAMALVGALIGLPMAAFPALAGLVFVLLLGLVVRQAEKSGHRGRSNSPRFTPSTNASHSGAVNTRTGPSGSRELRSGTSSPTKHTSTQLLYWLLLLFRHPVSARKDRGSRFTGSPTSGSRRRYRIQSIAYCSARKPRCANERVRPSSG